MNKTVKEINEALKGTPFYIEPGTRTRVVRNCFMTYANQYKTYTEIFDFLVKNKIGENQDRVCLAVRICHVRAMGGTDVGGYWIARAFNGTYKMDLVDPIKNYLKKSRSETIKKWRDAIDKVDSLIYQG